VDAYVAETAPRAALLLGSAATGGADFYSDLDLILYCDAVPAADALGRARDAVGAERFTERGERTADGCVENFYVAGVECQVAHVTIALAEREIERLVDELELDDELLKIASGLLEGLPLYGEDVIATLRARARYPDALQIAVIQQNWAFFPLWHFQERLGARDALLWRYDVLVDSAYRIVAVLAALNRVYFSRFEFKRMRAFVSKLETAPPNLADRIEHMLLADERESIAEVERLVAETRALLAERIPDVELSLRRDPGSRETPWA
jgi:hypothetical protein